MFNSTTIIGRILLKSRYLSLVIIYAVNYTKNSVLEQQVILQCENRWWSLLGLKGLTALLLKSFSSILLIESDLTDNLKQNQEIITVLLDLH